MIKNPTRNTVQFVTVVRRNTKHKKMKARGSKERKFENKVRERG